MSDYASQDDFDSLKENVSGLTDEVKTLSDSMENATAHWRTCRRNSKR